MNPPAFSAAPATALSLATSLAAPETSRPGDRYVQSFARGLAVIRSFGAGAPSQTLSDVARHTGLTRAGARRILLTLAQLGYVQAQGRHFSLTPKILDLGFAYLSSLPLWHLAEPAMAALAAELDEPCSAAVLDGADTVCVLRVPARGDTSIDIGMGMGIDRGVGSRRPAHATAVGRMLLAGLPAEDCRARLAADPHIDQAALALAIDEVRRQGWCLLATEGAEGADGFAALAAPIVDRAGHTLAALTVSGQRTRTAAARMQERFLPRLRDAARQVSQLLRMPA